MNLAVMKRDDLVNLLKTKGYQDPTESLTRKHLINKIKEISVTNAIETAKIDETKDLIKVGTKIELDSTNKETSKNIDIFHPEWTNYLLSLLDKSDKIKNTPTCNGVRKLFEKFIGEISDVDFDIVQPPNIENGGRAVIKCTICYIPIENKSITKRISDVADSYFGNTSLPYGKHPTSTAATMAEGRCYRKGLRMNVLLQEENQMPTGDEANEASILEESQNLSNIAQQNAIRRLSAQLKIEINKLLTNVAINGKTIETLTENEAQLVLRTLHSYQKPILNGGKEIPDIIKTDNINANSTTE